MELSEYQENEQLYSQAIRETGLEPFLEAYREEESIESPFDYMTEEERKRVADAAMEQILGHRPAETGIEDSTILEAPQTSKN
ncbi:MAG: hypothetical protein ABEK16_04055 [Candidatus Nanohalobium sp.]